MTEPDKPAAKKPRYGGRKPKLDPELVAAALVTLMGNVAAVARKFEVHRSSLQELIDKRPSLQQIVRDARLAMVDNAESSLNRAVLSGEAWAVCFTLKTQGKDRGYIEKQIIQNENANQPEFDFDKLTDQQKRAILNALRAATGNSESDDETA